MPANVKNIRGSGGTPALPLEAGTYPARVVHVIYMGIRAQPDYKGEPKDPRPELNIVYELADEFMLDEKGEEQLDKPRWVNETFPLYGLESDRAKSTARYTSLDPELEKEGEFLDLVGTPCLVTLTKTRGSGKNSDRFYNNVDSVQTMRSKDAAKAPPLVNDAVVFDFDEPDLATFQKLNSYIQGKIKEGLDFEGSKLESLLKTGSSGEAGSKKEGPKEEPESDDADW